MKDGGAIRAEDQSWREEARRSEDTERLKANGGDEDESFR